MQKIKWLAAACLLVFTHLTARAQTTPIDSIKFFTDTDVVEIKLTTDIGKLQIPESVELYQPAEITMTLPGQAPITEKIQLCARGKSRRINCKLPPIMLDFHTKTSPKLYSLSRLKLVIGCDNTNTDEQLLLKEFIVYKLYNQFDNKSFRARLVRVNYNDSRGKMKSYTQYAFLLEDVDDMAKRNACKASKKVAFAVDEVEPATMNKVDIFEYMIGNTDWSVPGNHNIKLIYPKKDDKAPVLPVPYDFDNSGLVNAYYAIPSEVIGTSSVTQRVYRGFSRPLAEVQKTVELFKTKRESLTAIINNFELFTAKTKKEIINYLDDFYKTINNPNKVKSIFVEDARKK